MRSAAHARHGDVTITIAYTVDARRMLDEADERWIAEHGFATEPRQRATALTLDGGFYSRLSSTPSMG